MSARVRLPEVPPFPVNVREDDPVTEDDDAEDPACALSEAAGEPRGPLCAGISGTDAAPAGVSGAVAALGVQPYS